MKYLTLLLLFVTTQFYAQISEITRFPMQDSTDIVRAGIIVHNNNDEILFIWHEDSNIYLSKSNDNGINWNEKTVIANSRASTFRSIITNSGRIILAFGISTSRNGYCYSDDNGTTWSEVLTLSAYGSNNFNLSKGLDSRIWITYKPSTSKKIYYKESTDDGETWSSGIELWDDNEKINYIGDLIQLDDTTLYSTANASLYDSTKSVQILAKYSYDNGISWGDYSIIYSTEMGINTMQTLKLNNDSIRIVINQWEYFLNPFNYNIYYLNSFNGGENWSAPIISTKYIGANLNPSLTEFDGKVFVVFSSDRFTGYLNLWYGIIGESDDIKAPPVISSISNIPGQPSSGDTLSIRTHVIDFNEIATVKVIPIVNSEVGEEIEMFDDGMHDDIEPNDGYYGVTIGSFAVNDTIQCSIAATDVDGNSIHKLSNIVIYEHANKRRNYLIDVNRFKLPINNNGVLADVKIGDNRTSGRYDDKSILYSGGFGLSGYADGELWASAQLTASRVEDYIAGPVGSEPNDTLNMIYILRSEDEPFGKAWQTWKTAVGLGAKFYDGDYDGIYNPVDLNGNEVWDENEDRPDLIGDVTTWTVFNDGLPAEYRTFYGMPPMNIEIKQTIFAYSPETFDDLDGVIFIRYIIENKSTALYDSVYFSFMSDPDVGEYVNDLVGSDTTINSGYSYDIGVDEDFGNSPTIMSTILQGVPIYIAGETYVDNNSNGIYDDGVDTPLDTAHYFNGEFITGQNFVGAKNLSITSFIHYISSHPTQGDADNHEQLRNYHLGYNQQGDLINPCDWEHGEVFNEDCNSINPRFMYSGNPAQNTGWINTGHDDQRMMISSGPFTLTQNESVEIIGAYAIGRGSTSLESIDVTKEIVNDVIGFYNTNFSYVPVGVKKNPKQELPTEYSLSQNYPNPFNPSTTIKYSIPRVESGHAPTVQLKVYDILGREVAALVNKQQKAGSYEIQFDASNLTSGVYFYRLQSGLFNESRKMILLK